MPNYSHPKCYANKTNNCSHRISREHVISDNILELFEENKTVKTAGLPWIEHEKFKLLSRKSLATNVLCVDHNTALSPYDTSAGILYRTIQEFDDDFNLPNPKNDHVKVNGHDIEKWMLKFICGLIASNQISSDGKKIHPILKDIYIDLLFNNVKWPEHWGLYLALAKGDQIQKFNCVSFMPMRANNEIKVGEFLVNNFKFYLVLGKPDIPSAMGIHRIHKIKLTDGKVEKIIEFEWKNPAYTKYVELTRVGTTKETPPEWKDWMKK